MAPSALPSATVQRRIDWVDTDGSGHYHYSTATRLFEAAESELLERLGLLKDVYGRLLRAHVSFDYRKVLWFRDLVDARVAVARVGRTSITYDFEVSSDGQLCIEGTVVAVLVDDDGAPTPWSDEYRAVLTSASGSVPA